MKIVKIKSDGTPVGTHAYTETGEEIENIQAISWEVNANGSLARVELTFVDSPPTSIELTGEVKEPKNV